jgi:hypothetical protein
MALRLEDKKALVKEVNAVAGDSVTAVAAEYRGLSVAEMTALRKEARDAGVYMRVVKNTLARRAVKGTEFECMQDSPKGTTLCRQSRYQPVGNYCQRPILAGWQICQRWIRRVQCCLASWWHRCPNWFAPWLNLPECLHAH